MKDMSEGVVVPLCEGQERSAMIVFNNAPNHQCNGVWCPVWYGQLKLECGFVRVLALSALGTRRKPQ